MSSKKRKKLIEAVVIGIIIITIVGLSDLLFILPSE